MAAADKLSIRVLNLTAGMFSPEPVLDLHLSEPPCRLVRQARATDQPLGFGQQLRVKSEAGWSRKIFALLWDGETWLFFDGTQHFSVLAETFKWTGTRLIPKLFELACLSISTATDVRELVYVRPTLRAALDSGWSLDDIDLGFLAASAAHSEEVRTRLSNALRHA